jgi:hypothetical protein
MSYTCPECESELEAQVRELDLQDGEIVTILEDGRAIASKIGCSNSDCPSHEVIEEEEEKERATGATCGVRGCIKDPGHEGRHKSAPKKEEGAE